MKKVFVSIVQKCICVDFLLHSLINSGSYDYLNVLSTMKEENLRNIKVLCYLYNYSHSDLLILEDIPSLEFNHAYEDSIATLLQFNLKILDELEVLKKHIHNIFYFPLFNGIVSSYFSFTSFLHCFYSTNPHNNIVVQENSNLTTQYCSFFSINYKMCKNVDHRDTSIDDLRDIAINSVKYFFDYSLIDNIISDEHYEVFFGNDEENKFLQYFFKTNDRSFKIRILYKNMMVFYVYQTICLIDKTPPSLTKEDAQVFCDSFLQDRLGNEFSNLYFDEHYLNIYSYMNIPETYKFKYNTIEPNGKVNLTKGLYITIDAKYIHVSEISLF